MTMTKHCVVTSCTGWGADFFLVLCKVTNQTMTGFVEQKANQTQKHTAFVLIGGFSSSFLS